MDETKIPKVNEIKEDSASNDYLTICIGSFSYWQATYCFIASLTRYIATWNVLGILFLVSPTEFKCVEADGVAVEGVTSQCLGNCSRYEYASAVFESNLISSFDLVCDRGWLANLAQTVMMCGLAIGGFVFGFISDRFGRRRGFQLATGMGVLFMAGGTFCNSFLSLAALRLLAGVAAGGLFTISVVYILEIVGTKHKALAACISLAPDGIAEGFLALFAYLTTTWIGYTYVCTGASAVIFLLMLALPESPRWLMSQGRVDEAIDVVTKAAIFNKRPTEHIKDIITRHSDTLRQSEDKISKSNCIDIFKTKEFAFRVICMFLAFAVTGFLFYGVNQYVSFLGTDIYVNVVLMGLIQVIFCVISIVINKNIGRRLTLIVVYIITGILLISIAFLHKESWAGVIMGVLSIGTSNFTYAPLYMFTAELFPTSLRALALGFATVGSKTGGVVASFISTMSPHWIPAIIYGVVPIFVPLTLLLLPETIGQNLRDIA